MCQVQTMNNHLSVINYRDGPFANHHSSSTNYLTKQKSFKIIAKWRTSKNIFLLFDLKF